MTRFQETTPTPGANPVKTHPTRRALAALALIASASLLPATRAEDAPVKPAWTPTPVVTLDGFKVPECALWDDAAGRLFVSNIESPAGEYWTDDKTGYISLLGADNKVAVERWADTSPEKVVHGPKGMCRLGAHLYFTDNTRLMRCDAKTGKKIEVVTSGYQQANDLATDGEAVWLSDTKAGKVFRVAPDGTPREIPSPAGVNGLTCWKGRLFAVSWDLHEVYELDPAGKIPPAAFGLADHFKNLDGIEVLDDGSFVVSDFMGNKVSLIAPDRKTVTTLVQTESPADIGLNRTAGLLYVPNFMKDTLQIYRLTRKP